MATLGCQPTMLHEAVSGAGRSGLPGGLSVSLWAFSWVRFLRDLKYMMSSGFGPLSFAEHLWEGGVCVLYMWASLALQQTHVERGQHVDDRGESGGVHVIPISGIHVIQICGIHVIQIGGDWLD